MILLLGMIHLCKRNRLKNYLNNQCFKWILVYCKAPPIVFITFKLLEEVRFACVCASFNRCERCSTFSVGILSLEIAHIRLILQQTVALKKRCIAIYFILFIQCQDWFSATVVTGFLSQSNVIMLLYVII